MRLMPFVATNEAVVTDGELLVAAGRPATACATAGFAGVVDLAASWRITTTQVKIKAATNSKPSTQFVGRFIIF